MSRYQLKWVVMLIFSFSVSSSWIPPKAEFSRKPGSPQHFTKSVGEAMRAMVSDAPVDDMSPGTTHLSSSIASLVLHIRLVVTMLANTFPLLFQCLPTNTVV